jgi:hypothetical protein
MEEHLNAERFLKYLLLVHDKNFKEVGRQTTDAR